MTLSKKYEDKEKIDMVSAIRLEYTNIINSRLTVHGSIEKDPTSRFRMKLTGALKYSPSHSTVSEFYLKLITGNKYQAAVVYKPVSWAHVVNSMSFNLKSFRMVENVNLGLGVLVNC